MIIQAAGVASGDASAAHLFSRYLLIYTLKPKVYKGLDQTDLQLQLPACYLSFHHALSTDFTISLFSIKVPRLILI